MLFKALQTNGRLSSETATRAALLPARFLRPGRTIPLSALTRSSICRCWSVGCRCCWSGTHASLGSEAPTESYGLATFGHTIRGQISGQNSSVMDSCPHLERGMLLLWSAIPCTSSVVVPRRAWTLETSRHSASPQEDGFLSITWVLRLRQDLGTV